MRPRAVAGLLCVKQLRLRTIHHPHLTDLFAFHYPCAGSGSAPESLITGLLQHMDLSTVWKLRVSEGFPQHLWASCTDTQQWTALFNLNLSSCGLVSLPSAIGQLAALHVLRLNHNKLTSLPQELGQLSELEVLSVNHNQLTTLPGRQSNSRSQEAPGGHTNKCVPDGTNVAMKVGVAAVLCAAGLSPGGGLHDPATCSCMLRWGCASHLAGIQCVYAMLFVSVAAELRRCSALRELHLEYNRLVTPLLDLTHAAALESLQVETHI